MRVDANVTVTVKGMCTMSSVLSPHFAFVCF